MSRSSRESRSWIRWKFTLWNPEAELSSSCSLRGHLRWCALWEHHATRCRSVSDCGRHLSRSVMSSPIGKFSLESYWISQIILQDISEVKWRAFIYSHMFLLCTLPLYCGKIKEFSALIFHSCFTCILNYELNWNLKWIQCCLKVCEPLSIFYISA